MKQVFESPLPPLKGGRAKRRNMRPVGVPLLRGCPKGGGVKRPDQEKQKQC